MRIVIHSIRCGICSLGDLCFWTPILDMVVQQIIARCLPLRAGPVVNSNTPAAFATIGTVRSFRTPSCRVDRVFLVAFGPRVPPSPPHLFACHSPASVRSAVPARCPTLPPLFFRFQRKDHTPGLRPAAPFTWTSSTWAFFPKTPSFLPLILELRLDFMPTARAATRAAGRSSRAFFRSSWRSHRKSTVRSSQRREG